MRLRIIGLLVVAAAALLTSACSALRFAYNQAPEFTYWWIDNYIDFNDEQKPKAKEAVLAWFRWNRTTQLADYAAFVRRLETQAQADTTAERNCKLYDEVLAKIDTAVEHAVPAAAEIARTTTPEQLAHLEKKYTKNNKEFAKDYLQDTPEERLKASLKRSVEQAEKFYGRLNDAQRERLKHSLAQSPFDPQLWLAERKARQEDILAAIRKVASEHLNAEQAQSAVRGVVARIRTSPREVYRNYQTRLWQYNCNMAAQLHNSTTLEQRKLAAQKLRDWNKDLQALMGD